MKEQLSRYKKKNPPQTTKMELLNVTICFRILLSIFFFILHASLSAPQWVSLFQHLFSAAVASLAINQETSVDCRDFPIHCCPLDFP